MRVTFDSKKFKRDMDNIVDYSVGFLDGINSGKKVFLSNLGRSTIIGLKEFIDTMARVDPEALHHVYEWNQTGSPAARLFDLDYTVSNLGLSLKSTFRQSVSVANGSSVPFYNKAMIMESGSPVTIRPVRAEVLKFTDEDGNEVFTKNPVRIENPGGTAVQGAFEHTLDIFVNQYFSQSFLNASGIIDKLKDISIYNKNFASGAKLGRSRGMQIGYRWIINAGVIN
jgi:hypothetical protein